MEQSTIVNQASDPYDGVLPLLEARVERTRTQETESEAMKALETITETAAPATAMEPGARPLEPGTQCTFTTRYPPQLLSRLNVVGVLRNEPRHCPDCQTGLIRVIRNSDDTVRHVNGEKCKRFHQ